MRGSGSHDVVLNDVFVPELFVQEGGVVGEWNINNLLGVIGANFPLVGAPLGIAEAARDHVVELVKTRRKAPSNRLMAEQMGIQQLIAEIEIGLTSAPAALGRSGQAIDAYFGRAPEGMTLEELHELMKDWQCTKLIVQRSSLKSSTAP